MTAARPAVPASCIIAWMRGLAAMSAPKCAGAAMFYFSTSSDRRPHSIIPENCIITLMDIFLLGFIHRTWSKMPVRTQTPNTSAVVAVPMPKGTSILLIETHLFLSTPLTTAPRPPLPLILELPSEKPRTAFFYLHCPQ